MDDNALRDWERMEEYKSRHDWAGLARYNRSRGYSTNLKHERIPMKSKEDKMVDFMKGVNVKSVTTKYGEILKIGIKIDDFSSYAANDKGYINFDICKGKSGRWYAQENNYKKAEEPEDFEDVPF